MVSSMVSRREIRRSYCWRLKGLSLLVSKVFELEASNTLSEIMGAYSSSSSMGAAARGDSTWASEIEAPAFLSASALIDFLVDLAISCEKKFRENGDSWSGEATCTK